MLACSTLHVAANIMIVYRTINYLSLLASVVPFIIGRLQEHLLVLSTFIVQTYFYQLRIFMSLFTSYVKRGGQDHSQSSGDRFVGCQALPFTVHNNRINVSVGLAMPSVTIFINASMQ